MKVNFHAHLQSGRLQSEHCSDISEQGLTCVIHSNHPLAVCLVKEAVRAGLYPRVHIETYSMDCKPLINGRSQILILDTCSIQEWAGCLEKWRREGGITLALVSSEPLNNDLHLQMLYLGVAGVLTFSDDLNDQLPRAIRAVVEGRVWVTREVLSAYVNRTRTALYNLSVSDQGLTAREKEILDLLQRDFTNRMIAQRFAISERTIKFHVSNILRKLNLTTRRDLILLKSSGTTCLSDFSRLHCISQSAQNVTFNPRLEQSLSS